MRLIFVRHGEPDYKNDCLTENGIRQAKSTAVRLNNEPIKAIYASPMGRTRQTASFTAEDHGLEIQDLDFMHEIDWGIRRQDDGGRNSMEYDGHPWTLANKLLTENPELVGSEAWRQHPYFGDNKCLDYYDMISQRFDDFLSSYGFERKDGLYYCREKSDDTIALFAHGGSGAVMFSHVFGLPFPFVLSALPYDVCSVSIVVFDSNVGEKIIPRLELFNDLGHIDQRTVGMKIDK